MLKRDIKGVSAIVATLFVILLVIVAVGIIWVVVRNVTHGGNEQTILDKYTLDLEISQIKIINDTGVNVTVKRNTNMGKIVGINFVIYDGYNSKIINQNISILELESNNYQIGFSVENTSNIKEVLIAPIFKLESGGNIIGTTKNKTSSGGGGSSSGGGSSGGGSSGGTTGCTSNADCSDGNSCTTDICSSGICSNPTINNCCASSLDCNDNDGCTIDSCFAGICSHSTLSCNDNSACTTDICSASLGCQYIPITNCCTINSDCSDGNSCTTDICSNGVCSNPSINCNDNNACTIDSCSGGICANTQITCNDNNECTTDTCFAGACQYPLKTNGTICTSDGNSCTNDICTLGVCSHPSIQGCGVCTDTCSSLGYNCGTQTVCGTNTNCGSCNTGYTCNSTGICIACTANSSSSCYNGDVYWYNSCGNIGLMRYDCNSTQTCSGGACVNNPPTGNCGGQTCKSGEYCSNNVCLLTVSGNTYFVSTTGNDNNPGTFAQPWKTWQKGMATPVAGDIVYFRGGVYYPNTFASGNNIIYLNPSSGVGHNGAPGNPIRFFNYPNEVPILDCVNMVAPGTAPANRYISGIMMYDVHWIDWRGLTIRNVLQREANVEPKGIVGYPISNMNFERMTVHDIGGAGWYLESDVNQSPEFNLGWDGTGYIPYDNTRFVNCDTYNCVDVFPVNDGQTPGNLADGFKFIVLGEANISYEGCRSWHNADDGFDLPSTSANMTVNNCWSFNHIYPGEGANYEGNGLKLAAGNDLIPQLTKNKIITNNIFANCDIGIYFMDGGIYQSMYSANNNFIYNSSIGMQLREDIFNDPAIVDRLKMDFHNNIIYNTTSIDAAGRPYDLDVTHYYTESHNTWDYADDTVIGSLSWWKRATDVTVTDADFVSLNISQLMAPRKADGSLPDITFGHLAAGSDLINAGVNVGLPYSGSAPDLGPFESNY